MHPSRAVATDMASVAVWRQRPRRRARVGWIWGLVALASGCLVTDHPEYGEPIVPSNLVPLAPAGFTRVPSVADEECTNPSSTPVTDRTRDLAEWMAFEVEVSDANVEDSLDARLVVNGREVSASEIPQTGEAYRGRLRICAKLRDLSSAACNRVEMLVSTGFHVVGAPYATRQPGDLARWEWWVMGPSEAYPEVKASDCTMQDSDAGAAP